MFWNSFAMHSMISRSSQLEIQHELDLKEQYKFTSAFYLAPENCQYTHILSLASWLGSQSDRCRQIHGILMIHNSMPHNLYWPSRWMHIEILLTCHESIDKRGARETNTEKFLTLSGCEHQCHSMNWPLS